MKKANFLHEDWESLKDEVTTKSQYVYMVLVLLAMGAYYLYSVKYNEDILNFLSAWWMALIFVFLSSFGLLSLLDKKMEEFIYESWLSSLNDYRYGIALENLYLDDELVREFAIRFTDSRNKTSIIPIKVYIDNDFPREFKK